MFRYFNSRYLILYVLPFLLGSLSVLSFQPFNLTIINFFTLPFFFYLIVYIKKKSKSIYRKKPFKKNLFITGTSYGFGFYLCGIHWITHSLTFDESFKIFIPLGLIFIPLFLSLFTSIVILIIGPFLNMNLVSVFLFSGSLAFSDYLRAKILSGFPWNLWAYSFSSFTEIIQILNNVGLFAFNLFSITIFMLPAVIFMNLSLIKKSIVIFLIPILLFFSYIYGNYSINQNKKNLSLVKEKYFIKVIGPNFDLKYDLDNSEIEKRLKKLIKYSEPDRKLKTLFVWPEGVFSGYSFEEIIFLKEIFFNNFTEDHLILFGVNRLDAKKKGHYNSLVIVDHRMNIIKEYHKQKLVPFGEFLPFEKFLSQLGIKKNTEGYSSLLSGSEQKNLAISNLNILPLICYEVIFTKFIQRSDPKTNLIINISEDGWFGNSIGPYQHFIKGVYRAIEQNSFLIRSTNKGLSVIINNKGEIIKKLKPNETGNLELEVPLVQSKNKNKNDLIFFALLITYIFIFLFLRKKYE